MNLQVSIEGRVSFEGPCLPKLEISNLGPFNLELKEGDVIAQIVVAMISSRPRKTKQAKGVPIGQSDASGQAGTSPPPGPTSGT